MSHVNRGMSTTRAVLIELALVGLIIASAYLLPGCATVRTISDVGTDLCRVWMAQHPERATKPDGLTCDAIAVAEPFVDAVNLAVAKPQPDAIKEALAAHPPLSAAANAAMAMPMCITPKLDPNPYAAPPEPDDHSLGPQSFLMRSPLIVEPEQAGE